MATEIILLPAGTYAASDGDPTGLSVVTLTASITQASLTVGQTASLTTNATSGTATYQWKRDGVNIGGATSATYTTQGADTGTDLTCAVTSGLQTVTTAAVAVTGAASGLTKTYLGHDVISSSTAVDTFTFSSKTLGTGTIIVAMGLARNATFTIGSVQAGTGSAVTSPMTDGSVSATRNTSVQSTAAIYAIPCTDATGDIVVTLSAGTAWGCHITWWLVEGSYDVTDVTVTGDTLAAPWTLSANVNTVDGGAVFVAGQTRSSPIDFDDTSGFTTRGISVVNTSNRGLGGDNLDPGTNSPLAVYIGDADQSASNAALVVVSIEETP